MKILVVDDDKNFLLLIRHTLADQTLIVRTTTSPLEALSLLIENSLNFDLLVTDVKMPLIDGVTLREKVRLAQPDLKVFGVSAFHLEPEERNVFEYFLPKPFRLHDFRSIIDKAACA